MSQRFEGKNLEEALSNAAEALGVERERLSHHIVLEKRGFLGGFKRVVIEATVNPEAERPAAATPAPVLSAPVESRPAPPASRPPRDARGGRGGRSGGGGGGGRRDGRGRGNDRGEDRRPRRGGRGGGQGMDFQPGDFARFSGDVPEQGPESDAALLVRDWIEEVLDLARVDVELRTEESDEQINVRLYGRDSRKLLDEQGELLDAVQVLANKALVGRKVEKEIEVDCHDFKAQRSEDIGQRARELADRVRRERREHLLPAMSPVERRIVHLALQDDADVTTESRGDGFYKRVALILRPATTPSEDAPAAE